MTYWVRKIPMLQQAQELIEEYGNPYRKARARSKYFARGERAVPTNTEPKEAMAQKIDSDWDRSCGSYTRRGGNHGLKYWALIHDRDRRALEGVLRMKSIEPTFS